MRRVLSTLGLGFVLLVLLVAGITYSWTFTPLGRLDYVPAIYAKLGSWATAPIEFTPEARRAANEYTASALGTVEAVTLERIEDRGIPGPDGNPLPVRIYWPDTEGPHPLYLDIHGGGWWMGDGFPFHSRIMRFAALADVIVVSVDYRLAPEHPYPAALDDCHAALTWMYQNAAALDGDPRRLAIGGGSAGGNLSAALALRVRDEGGPDIAFQYLLVPATDLSGTTAWPSYGESGEDFMLKVSGIEQMIAAYVPDPTQRSSPYVSPLLAADHRGLPPALVVTALFDPLRDEGEAYARKLQGAGVPVELHREEGALHGFVGSPDRFSRIQEMGAKALRNALAR
jgi:acetyl esterase